MLNKLAWNTKDEINYIKRLPQELVSGYCHGCQKRSNWEGMDSNQIIHSAMDRFFDEMEKK